MDKGKPAPNADVNLRRFIERIDTVKDGPITDPSVKNAVSEHRKREQIKSMSTPLIWSQDELYERKVVFAGMRERALLNAFREVRTRLLQKSKSDNIVVLVSSIAENGGGTFVAFNLAATFALDRHKTALYVDCNPYQSTTENTVLSRWNKVWFSTCKITLYRSSALSIRPVWSGCGSSRRACKVNPRRRCSTPRAWKCLFPK